MISRPQRDLGRPMDQKGTRRQLHDGEVEQALEASYPLSIPFSIRSTPHCCNAAEKNLGSPRSFSMDTTVGWRFQFPSQVVASATIGAEQWKTTANQIKLPPKVGVGKRCYKRWINRRLLIGNLRRLVHERGQPLGSDDLGDYIDDELLGIPYGRPSSRHRGLYAPGAQYIPGYRSAPNLWWRKLMLDEDMWWSFRKRREPLPRSPAPRPRNTGSHNRRLANRTQQPSAQVQQAQLFERRVYQIFSCMQRTIALGPPFIMNFLRTVEETTFNSLIDTWFCKSKQPKEESLEPKVSSLPCGSRFYFLEFPSSLIEVFPGNEGVTKLQETIGTTSLKADPRDGSVASMILLGLPSLHRKLCYLTCRAWKIKYHSYQVDVSDLLALLGNHYQMRKKFKRLRRNRVQKVMVLQLEKNARLSLPEHSICSCLQDLHRTEVAALPPEDDAGCNAKRYGKSDADTGSNAADSSTEVNSPKCSSTGGK